MSIRTRPTTDDYRNHFDSVFKKKAEEEKPQTPAEQTAAPQNVEKK